MSFTTHEIRSQDVIFQTCRRSLKIIEKQCTKDTKRAVGHGGNEERKSDRDFDTSQEKTLIATIRNYFWLNRMLQSKKSTGKSRGKQLQPPWQTAPPATYSSNIYCDDLFRGANILIWIFDRTYNNIISQIIQIYIIH